MINVGQMDSGITLTHTKWQRYLKSASTIRRKMMLRTEILFRPLLPQHNASLRGVSKMLQTPLV
jgi:hypothetical protein